MTIEERTRLLAALILTPEHTQLRYHDKVVCDDQTRLGGFLVDFEAKEWRCMRCCLIDLLETPHLCPEGISVSVEFHGSGGNVR